ncbi:MAG TPA: hypothetical protein VG324_02680, partial [Blastocatellia bacterium]|nr:hypothetical protein [Blastocatellia bacterium]
TRINAHVAGPPHVAEIIRVTLKQSEQTAIHLTPETKTPSLSWKDNDSGARRNESFTKQRNY